MDEDEVRREPTVYSLDEQLSNIVRRLSDVSDDLNTGIYGNQTKCEDAESNAIESPSLTSIQRRCDLAQGHIADIERLTSKIHSSKPIAG